MGDKMKHEVDLKNYTIRTDLALESIENNSIDKIKQEFESIEDIKVTTTYLDEKNGKKIDKKAGIYITIEFEDVTDHDNLLNVKKCFLRS